jgi:CRP/FNR family transcriptional regulator, cyclic AMP receptor protein
MTFHGFFEYPTIGLRPDTDFVLLDGWSDAQWQKLRSFTEHRRFRAGELVVGSGDSDRSLYIIVEGTLEVTVGGRHTPPIAIHAGSLIGEVAFFDGLPRGADVRAVTDADLLRLSYEDFEVFSARHDDLARELLLELGRLLALRLRRSQERFGR